VSEHNIESDENPATQPGGPTLGLFVALGVVCVLQAVAVGSLLRSGGTHFGPVPVPLTVLPTIAALPAIVLLSRRSVGGARALLAVIAGYATALIVLALV